MEDGIKLEVGTGVKEWVIFRVGDVTGFRAGLDDVNRACFRNQVGVEFVCRAGLWMGLNLGMRMGLDLRWGRHHRRPLCPDIPFTTHPWPRLPEACLLLFIELYALPFCIGALVIADLNLPLRACPCEHVLRSGQLRQW